MKFKFLEGIGEVPLHFIDIRGETFGKLKVLKFENIKTIASGRRVYNYLCECVCGKVKTLATNRVKSDYSCGCCAEFDRLPRNNCSKKLHGLSGTRTYRSWSSMQSRCHNPNSSAYGNYGALGIFVCPRWREPEGLGFLNFLEDMGERPEDKSLNRINGSNLYSKETCAWATLSEQNFDMGRTVRNTSGRTGVTWMKDKQNWRAKIHVDNVNVPLGHFTNFDDAVKAREEAELKYYGFIKESVTLEDPVEI